MSIDIKRAETIAMIDKAIEELNEFRSQMIDGTVVAEDITINQRLRSEAGEATGMFNMNIDIDYTLKQNPKN
ncbi:hypothetical protein MXE73_07030 [Enterococcus faecalis]|uniref:hypothetical protein n=1 Tax=Enterococcus faecalis TaxID=1351 RepID=UPI0019217737|nr:hypothetical protein [Enterococcus faecalis]MEB6043217.1 hypothetical protein [Enterococcus faecalis]MEB6173025.1 hypothetical protein [Enterococcus faecalis]